MATFTRGRPIVQIKNVSKIYEGKVILRDIGTEEKPFIISDITRPKEDMQAGREQGQTVAVVGASGSGKSTLFRLMSGIHAPTSGIIEVPDNWDKESYCMVKAGDVGFVQQTYPLSRNQNIIEMLYDVAAQGNIPVNQRKEVIESYLEARGLTGQRFSSKNKLSGGQRQRVAIIEQLLCSHTLFIFDEPFSGLDVRNIDDVKASFTAITTTSEINTIIFSTHDIRLAVELADLIFVVGYEKDESGKFIDGGTIIRRYDQKDSGLAWIPYSPAHEALAMEIQQVIKDSKK
jgi:ABC-type multidrug transport system ATPase subunit